MIWRPKVVIISQSKCSQFLGKRRGCQRGTLPELRYCCNVKKNNVEKQSKQSENQLQIIRRIKQYYH